MQLLFILRYNIIFVLNPLNFGLVQILYKVKDVDASNWAVLVVIIETEAKCSTFRQISTAHYFCNLHESENVDVDHFWHALWLYEYRVEPQGQFFHVDAEDVLKPSDHRCFIYVQLKWVILSHLWNVRKCIEYLEDVKEVF